MRLAAWIAVFLTIGITVCYAMGWFWLAFAMTFLLAMQSAIYSPAKYGYIKALFGKQHLAEANNLIQNIGMLFFLIVTVAFAVAGISSGNLLLLIAVVAVIGFAYTVYHLPQSMVRFILTYLMNLKYKVDVDGMKNIPATGGVLLLGNHISWIDWAIVQLASPRRVRFVMLKSIYERWYLSWFFKLFGSIPIEAGPSSTKALEKVAELLNEGSVVCLFPEGAISRNGHLGLFKHGYRKAAKLANKDVVIVPFYLRGLWGSQFSRSSARLKSATKNRQKRQLMVSFGPQLAIDTETEVLKQRVFDLSISAWDRLKTSLPSLGDAWIESARNLGSEMAIADTATRPLSANNALIQSFLLSKQVKREPCQNVGILLPTSQAAALTNMAVILAGKTVVNLDYTVGPELLERMIKQARIDRVYTSGSFLEQLNSNQDSFDEALQSVDIEDVDTRLSKHHSVGNAVMWCAIKILPLRLLRTIFCSGHDATNTAAIVFTQTADSELRAVELSHQNILVNLKQVAEVLNAEGNDVIMASLPLSQAFGLTCTQFLPLIEGLPMVCHADPWDSIGIAKAVAKYNATILLGTAGMLDRYTHNEDVRSLMFKSLRLVMSGAEPITEAMQTAFKLKFSKDILEGYGTSETAPVASVNLPDLLDTSYWQVQQGTKSGTVGMPLPGASFKIVDPESYESLPLGTDGMILIGGPQLMKGYFENSEATEQAILELEGVRWFISGDSGYLDEDGFLTISNQANRFIASAMPA